MLRCLCSLVLLLIVPSLLFAQEPDLPVEPEVGSDMEEPEETTAVEATAEAGEAESAEVDVEVNTLESVDAPVLPEAATPEAATPQAATPQAAGETSADDEQPTDSSFVEMILAAARVPRGQVDSQEPITDNVPPLLELRSSVVSLRVGMLLSALVDVGFTDPQRQDNGFAMTDARLALFGSLGEDWAFLFQTDFARSPALLDFRLTYEPAPWMRIQAGLFKVPFGAEFLIPAADTDLNNRAQLNALVPGRSVGLEVGGRVADGAFFYRAGVYNGTLNFQNDDRNYLGALRLGINLEFSETTEWTLGANAAYSRDTSVVLGVLDGVPFDGERLLAGVDTRFIVGPLHIAAELVFARFKQGGSSADAHGFHVTAGYAILDWFQVLARYDRFENFAGTVRQLIIPSLSLVVPNLAPLQFQADAEIPVDDPDQTRVIASMTVAF